MSDLKAYHQIVGVPEDNDDREVRISFSKLRPVQGQATVGSFNAHCPGTDCAALRYETKPPGCAGGSGHTTGSSLPVDQEAGSATWATVRAAAKDITAGDKLDPKRTIAFVVRGGTGLA